MRFLLVASAEIRRFELCGALPAFNHGPVTLRVYAGALTLSSACEARLAFVAFGSGEGKAYSTSDGPAHHQVPYIYGGVRSHQPAFRCPSLYVPDIDLSFTLSTADRIFECQALTETTPICLFYGGVCGENADLTLNTAIFSCGAEQCGAASSEGRLDLVLKSEVSGSVLEQGVTLCEAEVKKFVACSEVLYGFPRLARDHPSFFSDWVDVHFDFMPIERYSIYDFDGSFDAMVRSLGRHQLDIISTSFLDDLGNCGARDRANENPWFSDYYYVTHHCLVTNLGNRAVLYLKAPDEYVMNNVDVEELVSFAEAKDPSWHALQISMYSFAFTGAVPGGALWSSPPCGATRATTLIAARRL